MIGINLIPRSVQLAQVRRAHTKRWGVSVAVSAAAVSIAFSWDWTRRGESSELREQSEQLQVEVARARFRLRSISAEVRRVRLQIERANALKAKRAWSGMITLVGSCLPEQSWLTSIGTDPSKPIGHSPRVIRRSRPGKSKAKEKPQAVVIDAPTRLRITGYAREAIEPNEFVSALKATDVFEHVELVRAQRESVQGGSFLQFEIMCRW